MAFERHNTQHVLLKLLHSWQKKLDQKVFVGTNLIDLSKAYDCIPHNILIVQLECYGIDKIGRSLILYYLSRRKQRTKIGSSYTSWYDMIRGALQGSILAPLLFNVFINNLFFVTTLSEVCNFADDNTLHKFNKELKIVFRNLESDLNNVLAWFDLCSLKVNPGKFQFIFLGTKDVLNEGKSKLKAQLKLHNWELKLKSLKLKFESDIE